jgi:dUTP pyrophosphatase
VKIARVSEDAILPSLAHSGDAGFDLYSIDDVELTPQETVMVRTGLVMEIPVGYGGFILPRSGMAVKKGITIPNAPGLIDSGYRGEIMVGLHNTNTNRFQINKGDRIAQIVFIACFAPAFTEATLEELERSERNTGGFGSSGY